MNKLKAIIKKYWENITWLEVVLISGLAFVMMYGLLYKMGTLSSGYHFLDDHELIRIDVEFKEWHRGLGEVMHDWIQNDLRWRFRPLYWVERTIMANLFGANLLYWNIYTAIKGSITFALLYFTARYWKCNPIFSGLFTCIILYGGQFTPWYRSANQENTGLLLCALTLCLIAAQSYYRNYQSKPLNALIVVAAVLCGCMKESFTLILPAFVAVRFWLEYRDKPEYKWWECLKAHWLTYSVILVSFLANIVVLLFYVGVDQVSYAGFHEESGLAEYWHGIVNSYRLYLRWYVNLALPLLGLLIARAGKKKWCSYWGYGLIGFYIIGIQLVAHAKSGMWERYLIPWIVGYAVVFVIVGYRMLQHRKISMILYGLVLCVLLGMQAPMTLDKGRDYAYDGQMIRLYFQNILDNTEEDSHIVSMFFDEELNLSTECWLEVHGRTQVYSVKPDTGELINQVQLRSTAPTSLDLQNAKVFTCYDNQVQDVLNVLDLSDPEQYTLSVNGHYAVISKK